MPVSVTRSIIIILACAACTFALRLLPFLIFRNGSSPIVSYLGKVLPAAIIATLVVYCLRGTSFTTAGGFLPQIIAVAVTAGLHLWKRNTLISVFAGTVVYMCLVQFVFL